MTDIWKEREIRIRFFRELLTCCHDLYSWTYDTSFQPVFTNCPNEILPTLIFALEDEKITSLASIYEDGHPIVMTNPLGLMWIADFERDASGKLLYIHVIGPAFYDDVSSNTLEQMLNRLNLSLPLKQQFSKALMELPVISSVRMLQYGQMLHFALTGEKISSSEFTHLAENEVSNGHKKQNHTEEVHRHGTWLAEQAMMKFVEDGNLDYRKQRDRIATSGRVGKMSVGDPIRQVKNQMIVLTALCTRAAIRGGLNPDTAYTLSDRYIQNIESCITMAELAEVGRTMEDDFVRRVHQIKTKCGISPQIQQCCDYILLHITEKITVETLADLVGHAPNYLSKKFRQETGKTISAYIMDGKMEYAKLLLKSSNDPIQDIAEQLGFSTQSHFGAQFKAYTHMTPAQWRAEG